ncbi:MAG: hypothetical protein JW704_09880 [Anaerolineaceae bacterium]|nr:hypothetical protein [Anaerolineaceae bacterium]
MNEVIGRVTTYKGTEHHYLNGYKVRIIAVLKPGMGEDDQYIRDDEALERAGGVTVKDRVEVQPWLEKEGRFSFVTSDAKAQDLACFTDLGSGGK